MKLLLATIKSPELSSKLVFKYIYNVIEKAPIDITVREFEESDLTSDIYESILRGGYNIVYFHVNQTNSRRIAALAEMFKKAAPTSIVVAGGMFVSFDTQAYMEEHPYVDYVIRGEAEHVMFNFMKTVVTYEFDFASIPGLAYREDDNIIVNPYDAPVQLEDLPFPYEKVALESDDVVYYESFRGAADRCKYAQYIPEFNIRSLSLNRVCTELRYFLVKNVKKVVFVDKWFNYNIQRAYRIWEYILNNDNGRTSFVFDIDGDNLDDEAVRLLSTAREGLFEFNVDIESTNAEVLSEAGRKENIYPLMYNITKLMQSGTVKVNINLKAGMPCESKDLFARSFNKAYGLGATTFNVDTLCLPVGCKMRDELAKYSYQISSTPPYRVISSSHMNALELLDIRRVAKIADVFASKGFGTSIPRLLTDTGLKPYDLFEKLTTFIYNHGYERKLDSIEARYRIVYAFATGIYDELNETLKIQIMMDILHAELEDIIGDDIRKFEKKGWAI